MPQFIKMGISSTGHLGNKERSTRVQRRWNARRRVLPGFPIETPFSSILGVREYLRGDRIICLRCGKPYKKLGNHLLKIHGMQMDEYKALYKIPWTYSLICPESSRNYKQASEIQVRTGYPCPPKQGSDLLDMVRRERRVCPFKREVSLMNLKGRD